MKIAIAGEKGRMAQALQAVIAEDDAFTLLNTIERGEGVPDLAEAIIDFTAPDNSVDLSSIAAQRGLIHVIGTTGFTPQQDEQIAASAQRAVIVKSGNMSLGINLLMSLVAEAATKLPHSFDIEILEMHHRNKIDAPSGTALMLGSVAEKTRNINKENSDRSGKRGNGIGYASLRGGSVIGEHDVIFAGPSERIILSHKAEDRAVFARGALAAAVWAKGKPPGLYSMRDVMETKK